MLKIMTSVITAFILSLTAFGSSAAQLPASLMDKDNPGQEYWCQGNDINTSMCSLTGVSDDHKFALIQDLPGPACEDLSFGIIDLVFNTGLNIPYDGGDCKGDVKAGFVRGTKDNALYVKIVRGSKTLRLYKVQTGF
ncbi:hypothetical protein Q6825_003046 [Escherichia coli]|uniref:hypothetical protein n=1 Tax=Escherichia coli TaxID=562 RepID=UPI0002610803|nr:hypothetical protein [Escherichia coli]HEB1798788.1 hypothetical protein [Escherichia albertii]EIL56141.1 hypothetical protein ECKD2_03895 [Escherichia coli KD2]ELK4032686.1 hypothetical protein [Escherichia coli]MCJ2902823.1 hypothetical protein [Escherichia coli]MDY8742655.1 hypothetical protein [Escherichia coli]